MTKPFRVRNNYFLKFTDNFDRAFAIDISDSASKILSFEGPALTFLRSIAEGKTKKVTINRVLKEYLGVNRKTVESDYDRFLKRLEREKIIEYL